MSKIKSPQEKKAQSLKRDRRNTYGENSKASRKLIPRGRQLSHMAERRLISEILGHATGQSDDGRAEEADILAKTAIVVKKHKAFKKTPDSPLGEVIKKKLTKRTKPNKS